MNKISEILIMIAILASVLISLKYAFGESSQTYDNPLFGFKFQYPSEWSTLLFKGNSGVSFDLHSLINSPYAIDSLGFFITDLPENMTLKQYLREYTSQKTAVNYESLKFNETKLSNNTAISATYEISPTISKKPVFGKSLIVFTIKDKTVYQIHYETGPEAFDKWLPQVKDIINSFQITG